jgi:protein-tyrosine phosphatase
MQRRDDPATAPQERALGLAGSPNFRDAGGYATSAGAALRWRRLFRSGHLAHLDEREQQTVAGLGLDLVIDLRRDDEREREPSRLPDGVPVLAAAIKPGSQSSALIDNSAAITDRAAMFAWMCDINRQFVAAQSDAYAAIFAALLEGGVERVLFHCSAGKDRTGFAVAMLHLALGVPLELVREDYLLSRDYYDAMAELPRARRKYRVEHLSDEALLPMLRVDLAYLDAALQAIADSYGDIDAYLTRGLGLDAAARRELGRRFLA